MQEIKTYLRAASVKAVLVDEADVVNNTKASLTRGMQAEMILYLFTTRNRKAHSPPRISQTSFRGYGMPIRILTRRQRRN